MPEAFDTIGLVGRSQQDGLDVVLQELIGLLQDRGHTVLLEDRLDELVPGHARIARWGIAQAIEELIDQGWLDRERVSALVERLMRGTALELFDHERALAAWA